MYSNIVMQEIQYPAYLSKESVNLLKGLLTKDPNHRLGYKFGVEEVKQTDFCKGIDWEMLKKKKIKCPLNSQLEQLGVNPSNLRTSNFDIEYTQLTPRLSLNMKDVKNMPNASELDVFSPINIRREKKKRS